MKSDQRHSHKEKCRRYLEKVGSAYVPNKTSGLYETQYNEAKPEKEHRQKATDPSTPILVNVRGWLEFGVAVGTLLLLVATVIYTRRQWLQANRSANAAEISSSSAAEAAYAAKTAADAAVKSSLDAEVFFQTDERAWIELNSHPSTQISTPSEFHMGEITEISFSLKNSGKTSARNLRISDNNRGLINGQETKKLVEDDFLKHLLPRPVPNVLDPGSDYPLTNLRGLLRPPYISFGHLILSDYVGRVEYDDIFHHHHWFTFCYVLLADKTLGSCQFGNDEDEEKIQAK